MPITITYLIFAHNNAEFLLNLIEQLSYPHCSFYIHIDRKSKEDFSTIQKLANVRFTSKNIEIDWGGISMVEALISSCQEIIDLKLGDTIVFLSGNDFPIKSNEYIYKYLNDNRDKNFITGGRMLTPECNWEEYGRRRLECYALRVGNRKIATIEPHKLSISNLKQLVKTIIYSPNNIVKALSIWRKYPQRKHPNNLKPYSGEFWWVLPSVSLKTIISYIAAHPEFLRYHQNTSNPDEIIFNTLAHNLLPHENIMNSCLRYIKWTNSPSPSNVTIKDKKIIYECLSNPDTLFIRKVDSVETCNFIKNRIAANP